MKTNDHTIVNRIRDAVVEASSTFSQDKIEKYEEAIDNETNEKARWALNNILTNAKLAKDMKAALCDDTGIPHVYLEVGEDRKIPAGFFNLVQKGIKEGLNELPTRPMAVRGNPVERVTQERGLYNSPGKLLPAPFTISGIPGDVLKLSVLMLGGGPEIRAKTYRIFHKRSMDKVINKIATWGKEMMPKLGCTPSTLAVGVGRTHFEAASLMLKAMKEGTLKEQSEWEETLTRKVNQVNVGPLGLGGNTTVLGSFIQIGPQRASGVRIVCLRPCCCMEPRKATINLP